MARFSRVLLHLSKSEIEEKIRTAGNFRRQQKWRIVYNALVGSVLDLLIATKLVAQTHND